MSLDYGIKIYIATKSNRRNCRLARVLLVKEEMNVIVYDRPGKLRMDVRPKPSIERDELLVKLRAYGMSLSDTIAYANGIAKGVYPKLVGEIVEVGERLTGFKIGDHCCFNTYYHCMKCQPCATGHNGLCQNRTSYDDPDIALAEYIKLPSQLIHVGGVIKVPDKVSFEDATHIGPLSNCINTLEGLKVQPGENAVIIGAGYMGLLHLQLLKIYPVSGIIVSEINEYRMKKAEEFGADQIVNPSEDATARIREMTNGGTDMVIVCTASPKAMTQAVEIVARNGRIGFFGGTALVPFDTSIRLDTNLVHYNGLTINGVYSSIVPDQYVAAARLIAANRLSVAGLNTHKFGFRQAQEVLKLTHDSMGLRAIINLD